MDRFSRRPLATLILRISGCRTSARRLTFSIFRRRSRVLAFECHGPWLSVGVTLFPRVVEHNSVTHSKSHCSGSIPVSSNRSRPRHHIRTARDTVLIGTLKGAPVARRPSQHESHRLRPRPFLLSRASVEWILQTSKKATCGPFAVRRSTEMSRPSNRAFAPLDVCRCEGEKPSILLLGLLRRAT